MIPQTEHRYILLHDGRILLRQENGSLALPTDIPAGMECDPDEGFEVGENHSAPLVKAPYTPESDRYVWIGLRESWATLSEPDYMKAVKGAELHYWRTQNMYCGSCGAPTRRETGISRRCTCCHREIFPSPAPAVLVLVTRGETALLVHARNFRRPFYGLVAGFVETGESMEQCVAREVREETSLEITDIRYFGSQSWPFPFNLMIGFTARWAGGEIVFADGELSEGGFFTRDNLPALATPPSLARAMIDAWTDGSLDRHR